MLKGQPDPQEAQISVFFQKHVNNNSVSFLSYKKLPRMSVLYGSIDTYKNSQAEISNLKGSYATKTVTIFIGYKF